MVAGLRMQQPAADVSSMATRLCALVRARIAASGSEGVRCEDIAARFGRHRSTIRREPHRGRGRDGMHRAERAHTATRARARRPTTPKLEADRESVSRVGVS